MQVQQPPASNLPAAFARGSRETTLGNATGFHMTARLFSWGRRERSFEMRQILNMWILLVMAAVLVTSGCATSGRGLSDTDQIGALLKEWKEAILAEDADGLMATYSENFAHDGADYDAEDKAGLREFIDWGIQGDRYADAESDIEDADVAIEEGVATVYPIGYTNWEVTVTIELTLAKEKAGWLITDMLIEGL